MKRLVARAILAVAFALPLGLLGYAFYVEPLFVALMVGAVAAVAAIGWASENA